MKKHKIGVSAFSLILVLVMMVCAACSTDSQADEIDIGGGEVALTEFPSDTYSTSYSVAALAVESEILQTAAPSVSTVLEPEASGKTVYYNAKTLANSSVVIDASNTSDGYVMIKYVSTTAAKLKVIITCPDDTKYTYNLTDSGSYEVFPLSGGDGTYKIGVYQNISGTKYSTLYSTSTSVKLTDEFAPFLRPNQYANFSSDSDVVKKAAELVKNCDNELEMVEAVYSYVVKNFSYDYDKAATVQSGYLPDVDEILSSKKGICFDYSAVMVSMLRSQGVPTKLVVGYAGSSYHAWVSVYSEDSGWVEAVIFFNGTDWKLMDPTFASTGNSSSSILSYINNTSNYSVKYLY